ncbi:MAG: hypothetical protein ACOYB4_01005 [Methyloceanibacter sp.]
MMQHSLHSKGETTTPHANPFLDLMAAAMETQLKAWQAYQVEGTRFVAKRLHANLGFMRSLNHCRDSQAMSDCQRAWLAECRKDYAEEWGRLIGTGCALGFVDLAGLGRLVSRPRTSPEPKTEPRPLPVRRPDLAA